MTRHVLTEGDRQKAAAGRRAYNMESRDAKMMRRRAEMALLDRMRAELAQPEWHTER